MIKSLNKFLPVSLILFSFILTGKVFGQYEFKHMSVGSLQSFYSAIGSEVEEGRIKEQQDGLQWPAIYRNQDMSAAKGLWIGCQDFSDASGNYPYRVVHVGPRVLGTGEFFPVELKMYSKFDQPLVLVDGNPSFQKNVEIDDIKPDMPYDRVIVNKVNTLLGLTMERKIFQFSNPDYNNFIVHDVTFTNTGFTDGTNTKKLDKTLKGVYIYYNWRLAPCKETRYVIGNGTGWGMNTMLDARGDGVLPDPVGEKFRTQFAWHGFFPDKIVTYNNIGGPIWDPKTSAGYVPSTDTVGRLGAVQFVGVLTLHADKSTKDTSDNKSLPITTYESSDVSAYSGNTAFDMGKMKSEYLDFITRPTSNPRHAYSVHPAAASGGVINFKEFANQTAPPQKSTPGGFSINNSYGPYDIAPGESIHLIFVEGAAGISREAAVTMGAKYKNAYGIPSFAAVEKEKNELVMTGKDSLMQTWKRAMNAYANGWNIPQTPKPPKSFTVTSGGNQIALSWDNDDPTVKGFEIYRALGQYDSTYHLLYKAGPNEKSYIDQTPVRGLYYFYYIVSVGDEYPGDPALNIPPHSLKSSRYYTQTFDRASLKRPAGTSMDQIRVVPNPYIVSADVKTLKFGESAQNQLAFFDVPGNCTIKIYTELGELIKTLEHADGSGDVKWDSVTDYNQLIVSGIYIAVVVNNDTGAKKILKFSVIR